MGTSEIARSANAAAVGGVAIGRYPRQQLDFNSPSGLSYCDIAAELGVAPSTVHNDIKAAVTA